MNLLETKHLIVKPTSLENIENVYALFSDPDLMRDIGKGVKTIEETRESLEKMIKHYKKHGFSFGDIYEKETGLFVGRGGLIYLEMNDTQPDIEVGYVLYKKFWKKGYATELTKGFLDWGFNNLSIDKIVAVTFPENENSRRVLERSGMNYVGKVNCYDTQVAKYEILKNKINYKKIQLIPATIEDYPIIQNMGRFYVYDISEIAGFVIVDSKGSEQKIDFNMAQFFILRKFRNKGISRYIAYQCSYIFEGGR